MADELFDGVGMAIGVQSGFGTKNATIAGLSGSLDSSDGIVLGDKNSGDAESGIVIPDIVPIVREAQRVAGSFTESWDAFLRAAIQNFALTFAMQGNGATTSNPAATDEAQPLAGLDAIWQNMGFSGASGTDPTYVYTPNAAPVYSTVKLWLGDLSFVFWDCLIETAQMVFTPGGSALCTANFRVGTHDPSVDFADGVTFPTFDYGTQFSLANPTVEGVAFAWGQTRGFETLTLNLNNVIEEFGDSNVSTTGIRQNQVSRQITVDGTLYSATADSDYEYQNAVATAAQTDDMSFQVGTAAGNLETVNAFAISANNVQGKGVKHDRRGTALVTTLSGAKCTGTTGGSEFSLTFN